ncbi:MAG: AAA family ATPase [Syntrophomonadaceae bacterium]|nr:AAA family ATPase [Syntrophomonadaceae bacterium]
MASIANPDFKPGNLSAYNDGWEHISDELKVLDQKIRRQLQLQHLQQGDLQFNQFKGLLISEAEIETLLNDNSLHEYEQYEPDALSELISQMELVLQSRIEKSLTGGTFLPLEYLTRVFELNHFEANCLLLCLALECDRKYEKLFSFLQDDVNCKYPTIDLALRLLCKNGADRITARRSFTPDAPLLKYLLQSSDGSTENGHRLLDRLQLNRRLVHYFQNPLGIDPLLQAFTKLFIPNHVLEPLLLDHDVQLRLRIWWENILNDSKARKPLALLLGPSGCGKSLQVKHLCAHMQTPLFIFDLAQMPVDERLFQISMDNVVRECLLSAAVPCFRHFNVLIPEENNENAFRQAFERASIERSSIFMKTLDELPGPIFILAAKPFRYPDFNQYYSVQQIELTIPGELIRKELWALYSQNYSPPSDIDWGQMASKFRFSPGQIKNALRQSHESGYSRCVGDDQISLEDLHHSCYAQGRHFLGRTAAKINTVYSWQDLIIPPDTLELLTMACNQMKNRHIVLGQWGFEKRLAYGRGLSMLFSGLPGTGKTMAAQVIARELNLELYRIDLAQVVSKYIGETEKNLRQVFAEAESSNAILFFDEADALFGKRSQVKDSHDRYANIEIAYLLQKVEDYDGISILATNLAKNLDDAFVRRITFIIEFPFPDEEYRKKIWISMFPASAPMHSEIDFDFLARRFELAGGNIKNIALAAAYMAAEDRKTINMKHVLRATKFEYQKIGRVLLREDLGEYYYEL